jgi:hypothetical protein
MRQSHESVPKASSVAPAQPLLMVRTHFRRNDECAKRPANRYVPLPSEKLFCFSLHSITPFALFTTIKASLALFIAEQSSMACMTWLLLSIIDSLGLQMQSAWRHNN